MKLGDMRLGALLGLILGVLFMCTVALAGDKIYHGKVIDADTKEPIEGAVVLAIWLKERATPAGPQTKLYDIKEILTERDGAWSIVGPEGDTDKLIPGILQLFLIYVTREPEFIVFKPGYCSWPKGFGIEACKGKLKPSGNLKIIQGESIEIPRLTKNEDRLRALLGPQYPSDEKKNKEFLRKQVQFLRLLDEERRNLGLDEYRYFKEGGREK